MVQMRTWLTVADNSGARQITCILPVGGDAGLSRGLGRRDHRGGEGSGARRPGQEGQSGAARWWCEREKSTGAAMEPTSDLTTMRRF